MITILQIAQWVKTGSILTMAHESLDWYPPFTLRQMIARFIATGKPAAPVDLQYGFDQNGSPRLAWGDVKQLSYRAAAYFAIQLYLNVGEPLPNSPAVVNNNNVPANAPIGYDEVYPLSARLNQNSTYEFYVQGFNLFGAGPVSHVTIKISGSSGVTIDLDGGGNGGDGGN
jgi:hypothetical protein